MGGRQHSYVNGNWPVTADAFDLTFLQHSQQCDFDFRGQVAYFVQENCPAISRFKTPQAPLRRTGEGALLVAEELGSNQRCGDCGAIHTNKCPFPAVGSLVDGARNQLLSRAGFAQNQDGGIRMCHLAGLAQHFTQLLGGADYVLKHRVTIDLLSQRQVFVPCPRFSLEAIIDISSRSEPPLDSTLFIQQRVVAKQKPAILPILAAHALFNLKRHSTCQAAASFATCSFEIVWMKVPVMSLISSRALHLFKGISVIVEQHLVRLKYKSLSVQDQKMLRKEIYELPELPLVLPESELGLF